MQARITYTFLATMSTTLGALSNIHHYTEVLLSVKDLYRQISRNLKDQTNFPRHSRALNFDDKIPGLSRRHESPDYMLPHRCLISRLRVNPATILFRVFEEHESRVFSFQNLHYKSASLLLISLYLLISKACLLE